MRPFRSVGASARLLPPFALNGAPMQSEANQSARCHRPRPRPRHPLLLPDAPLPSLLLYSCDGSDEWESGKCANTCVEEGREWREHMAERIKSVEQGASARLAYAEEGTKATAAAGEKVTEATSRIEAVSIASKPAFPLRNCVGERRVLARARRSTPPHTAQTRPRGPQPRSLRRRSSPRPRSRSWTAV